MTGWDYDESYKKELERPSTWEESTWMASNSTVSNSTSSSWAQPSLQRDSAPTKSTYTTDNLQHYNTGSARRPLPQCVKSTHSPNHTPVRGGFSPANSNRGGFFSNNAVNDYGTHGRCNDHGFLSSFSTQGRYDDHRSHDSYGPRSDFNKPANQTYGYTNCSRASRELSEDLNTMKIDDTYKGGIDFDRYEEIPIEAIGDNVPPPMETFDSMECHDIVHDNIRRCGYARPTPVQKHAIPICMGGRDLMACAQTGSGKTAAFCLPIVAGIIQDCSSLGDNAKPKSVCSPLALILSPTRELACQIHTEAKKFAHETGLRVVVVYGGSPVSLQLNELDRGAEILVATPGRLTDVLERRRVSLAQVKYLVIDEADRMLDMGFERQITQIVKQADMPPVGKRQTMLFSATFPREIQELAGDFLSSYIFLSVGRVGSSTDLIAQKVEYVSQFNKRSRLVELLEAHDFGSTTKGKKLMVVFVETKRMADTLENWLSQMGWHATSIHGDRSQHERERALKSFKSGNKPILVATDVAARGLDVPNVVHVINYDLPNEIDTYVHRIGRTGRAGKMGLATAFFTEKNSSLAKPLVQLLAESKQEIPTWLHKYTMDLEKYDVQAGRQRPKSGDHLGRMTSFVRRG